MCEHAPCPEQADGQDGQPEVAEEGLASVARRKGKRRWEEAMLLRSSSGHQVSQRWQRFDEKKIRGECTALCRLHRCILNGRCIGCICSETLKQCAFSCIL